MSSKEMFTDDEWHVLQWAVTDTMSYLAVADHGFWDTFKEASAAAKFMAHAKADATSPLVHDLAGVDQDRATTSRSRTTMADMAGEVSKRVREAKGLVAQKSPDDVDAFCEFILGVAKATAAAAHGVDEHEAAAIKTLEAALA